MNQVFNNFTENMKVFSDMETYIIINSKRFLSNIPLDHISMAQCTTAVTPLLIHWSYCSLHKAIDIVLDINAKSAIV